VVPDVCPAPPSFHTHSRSAFNRAGCKLGSDPPRRCKLCDDLTAGQNAKRSHRDGAVRTDRLPCVTRILTALLLASDGGGGQSTLPLLRAVLLWV
jgi:hypothetical protein